MRDVDPSRVVALVCVSILACSATGASSAGSTTTFTSTATQTVTTATSATTGDTSATLSTGNGSGSGHGSETGSATSGNTNTDTGEHWGTVDLTYYWVAYEGDYPGPADTDLETCDNVHLATVTHDFAVAIRLEGTGKLLDDRMLNIGGCGCGDGFSCFTELGPEFPWGMGSASNPLEPFVSIAVDNDVIDHGTILYSPELDGTPLPEGGTHDGCLRADDVGGGITGMHIDWFVALRQNYQTLDPLIPEQLTLHQNAGKCDYLG